MRGKNNASSEIFRSFVLGVLYSTKQGLYLEGSGKCLIPRLHAIEALLPTSKEVLQTPLLKRLQLSTHKGLALLFKALGSVPTGELQRVFSEVFIFTRQS